jgi:hypothetical protein
MLLRGVMLFRLVLMILTTVSASLWESVGFAETTRTKNELTGPVRSVTVKALGHSATETYDRAGHLIEAMIDLTHMNTATYSLFQYNQEGQLQEELALDPSGKLMYRKRVAHVRDSDGHNTGSVTAADDGSFQHAEFSLYDQRGYLWEQLWVNNSTAYKSLFDVLGRRIYSARYSKGTVFSELRYRYDEQGRLQELVSYNAQGAVTGRASNAYDHLGRCVRATTETFVDAQQRQWITTYEYDEMGNWIKELTSELPSTSQNPTTSTGPLVQERIIEYYDFANNNVP